MNSHVEQEVPSRIGQPDYSQLELAQVEKLQAVRSGRDNVAAQSSLDAIRKVAMSDDNLMPRLIEAVKVGVTLGEISEALRDEWGTWDG